MQQLLEKTGLGWLKEPADIRFLILWFMVAIYPLIVVPHSYGIRYPLGWAPPSYFYAPRWCVLMVVGIITLGILIKDRVRLRKPVFIPLGLFAVFGLISTLLAKYPITAWVGSPYRFTGFSTYLACMLLFILASRTRQVERLLGCMVATASIVSLLALLQYLGINLIPHESFRKGMIGYGTMANSNFMGTYTAFIMPGALIRYLQTRKLPWLVGAAIIYIGLLVSLCRGAWLASLVGLAIILVFAIRKPEWRIPLVWFLGICLVTTLAVLPLRHTAVVKKAATVPSELTKVVNNNPRGGNKRIAIWQETLKLLPQVWAFGVGPDNLGYVLEVDMIEQNVDKAHNIYLDIAITLGIFTLAAYLAFLLFFLRQAKTGIGFSLLMMLATYLIQGMSNIDVVMIMPLFWSVLGLILAKNKKALLIFPTNVYKS